VPLQGKLFTEELLDKSGVNWTSVRPVYIYGAARCWWHCWPAGQYGVGGVAVIASCPILTCG
jgi:hypothetical protein